MVESYTEVAIYFISPVILILNQKPKKQTANAVRVIGALEQMVKLGPNTQNHGLRYVDINLRCYTWEGLHKRQIKWGFTQIWR